MTQHVKDRNWFAAGLDFLIADASFDVAVMGQLRLIVYAQTVNRRRRGGLRATRAFQAGRRLHALHPKNHRKETLL